MRSASAICLLVLTFSLVCACIASDGADAGSGYIFEDGTLTVTQPEFSPIEDAEWEKVRSGTVKAVITESVVSVGPDAFRGFLNMSGLEVSVSLRSVGDRAFENTGLTSLDIPDSVETLGDRAFADCPFLRTVSLGSGLRTAGSGAFSGCPSLEEVCYDCPGLSPRGDPLFRGSGADGMRAVFGSSVTHIPDDLFRESSLEEAVFGTRPMSVGDRAFSLSDLKIIDMSCVGRTGTGSFAGTDLTSVTVPEHTGDGAFAGCASMRSADVSALSNIPAGLFMDCGNLYDVTVGKDLKRIGDRAFRGTAIADMVFPFGFLSLGTEAFAGCPMGSAVFLGDLSYAGTDSLPSGTSIVLQSVKDFGTYPFGEPASVMMPGDPQERMFREGTRFLTVKDCVTYVIGDRTCVVPMEVEFPTEMLPDSGDFIGWYSEGVPAEPARGITLTAQWDPGLPSPEPPPDRAAETFAVAIAAAAALLVSLYVLRRALRP